MKKYALYEYVLEDDGQEHGGVSYNGQTLFDLARECSETFFFDLINNGKIKEINEELKCCGIEPIDRRRLLNGFQVAIDLTHENEENRNLFNSPCFKTEEQADNWYRKLDFSGNEVKDLDIIMIHWKNGLIEDTYLLG